MCLKLKSLQFPHDARVPLVALGGAPPAPATAAAPVVDCDCGGVGAGAEVAAVVPEVAALPKFLCSMKSIRFSSSSAVENSLDMEWTSPRSCRPEHTWKGQARCILHLTGSHFCAYLVVKCLKVLLQDGRRGAPSGVGVL